jgi:hypothetical protein
MAAPAVGAPGGQPVCGLLDSDSLEPNAMTEEHARPVLSRFRAMAMPSR